MRQTSAPLSHRAARRPLASLALLAQLLGACAGPFETPPLGEGQGAAPGGARLLSQAAFDETHRDNILVSPKAVPEIGEARYGLGWALTSYRGRRLITHDGQVSGFQSHVSFLPAEGLGVVIPMNSNGLPAQWLGFDVYDQLLGVPAPARWSLNDG